MNPISSEFPIHRIPAHESTTRALFEMIPEPPGELWVQGSQKALRNLERLPERGLGIVGTRTPRAKSLEEISKVVRDLQGSELVILSGFARGVDAQAHSEAIRFQLPTVAVIASGLDIAYPSQHGPLRRSLLQSGGLIVSELEPGTEPRPHYFLRRNRIIAAWSQALWVVEAGQRSGALNTATWARDLHRTCFASPCAPGDPAFAGNQGLLDRHHALAVWGAHSFGASWLEVSGAGAGVDRRGKPTAKTGLGHDLVARIRSSTYARGGESIPALLDWAMARGSEPREFFELLESALEQGDCREERGILLSF